MEIYLTHDQSTRRITDILLNWSWSGDKSTLVRQLVAEIVFDESTGLPVPQMGDAVMMTDDSGNPIFDGVVLRRSAGSEETSMSFTCFDRGIYCRRNDGTYKFRDATPESITRQVCADYELPIVSLPSTGVKISRKFAGVALDKIFETVWTLATQQTEDKYAITYTPKGLLVAVRDVSERSIVLKAESNLMDARTVEDATNIVNSVAIYDADGSFQRRVGTDDAQKLFGMMERHLTENASSDVDIDKEAQKLLDDGVMTQTVTVDVLGDLSLITGQTVVVRENKTGLQGIFWIDADVHTWKRDNYYCKLTLNCRNVISGSTAGGELTCAKAPAIPMSGSTSIFRSAPTRSSTRPTRSAGYYRSIRSRSAPMASTLRKRISAWRNPCIPIFWKISRTVKKMASKRCCLRSWCRSRRAPSVRSCFSGRKSMFSAGSCSMSTMRCFSCARMTGRPITSLRGW